MKSSNFSFIIDNDEIYLPVEYAHAFQRLLLIAFDMNTKICKQNHPNKSSKTPPETASSSPSSSESCPESAKDLIKQLTVEHVKTWLQQTRFHHLAETWFTYNVNGKELLEISKTGHLTNGTFMLSEYELVQFKDILNRFGFELELE
ncbi:unnamed protein product [Rotaria sp. Silwood1]|nr:unnamed protein product [Rotaria sp. Silwood1]